MARIDKLENFCTDIASAIRYKGFLHNYIPPKEFYPKDFDTYIKKNKSKIL